MFCVLLGHQLNFCASPMSEGTKKGITTSTSIRMAAETVRLISCSKAIPVIRSEANTVASTSPRPRIVTQTLLTAILIASSSDCPFNASSRILVTKKMS